jgi:hypothetical protein
MFDALLLPGLGAWEATAHFLLRVAAMSDVDSIIAAIKALPSHYISGYEWECDGCHYHWNTRESVEPFVVIPRACEECGKVITRDENVDSTGRPADHDELISRDLVIETIRAVA